MTEIMPVPRNLNFTVLPAESFSAPVNGLLAFPPEKAFAHMAASVHSKPQTAGSLPSPPPKSCRGFRHWVLFPTV